MLFTTNRTPVTLLATRSASYLTASLLTKPDNCTVSSFGELICIRACAVCPLFLNAFFTRNVSGSESSTFPRTPILGPSPSLKIGSPSKLHPAIPTAKHPTNTHRITQTPRVGPRQVIELKQKKQWNRQFRLIQSSETAPGCPNHTCFTCRARLRNVNAFVALAVFQG